MTARPGCTLARTDPSASPRSEATVHTWSLPSTPGTSRPATGIRTAAADPGSPSSAGTPRRRTVLEQDGASFGRQRIRRPRPRPSGNSGSGPSACSPPRPGLIAGLVPRARAPAHVPHPPGRQPVFPDGRRQRHPHQPAGPAGVHERDRHPAGGVIAGGKLHLEAARTAGDQLHLVGDGFGAGACPASRPPAPPDRSRGPGNVRARGTGGPGKAAGVGPQTRRPATGHPRLAAPAPA